MKRSPTGNERMVEAETEAGPGYSSQMTGCLAPYQASSCGP